MDPAWSPRSGRALVARCDGEPLQDDSIYVFRNRRCGTILKRGHCEESMILCLQSDNGEGSTILIDFEVDGDDWNALGRVLHVEKHL